MTNDEAFKVVRRNEKGMTVYFETHDGAAYQLIEGTSPALWIPVSGSGSMREAYRGPVPADLS